MKKIILPAITGVVLALALSFLSHSDSLTNFTSNVGLYDFSAEEKDIEKTLKQFNKYFASFFNTGGRLEGLNEFPAANMIKRRIFQEIAEWSRNNRIIVYDKDYFEVEHIDMPDAFSAVAVAKETWFLNVQERDTRKHVSDVKASPIRVRYFLKKVDNKWLVVEYEVFAESDDMPEFNMEKF